MIANTSRARADSARATKWLVRSVAWTIEANARSTRSVSKPVRASMSAATAAAALWASRSFALSVGSNSASNSSTSDRAVCGLSLTTDSMNDWLYGKPACRRYFAYARSTMTCCQLSPARSTSSLNRSISVRPFQIAVTASANLAAVASRSDPSPTDSGMVWCGRILNW